MITGDLYFGRGIDFLEGWDVCVDGVKVVLRGFEGGCVLRVEGMEVLNCVIDLV